MGWQRLVQEAAERMCEREHLIGRAKQQQAVRVDRLQLDVQSSRDGSQQPDGKLQAAHVRKRSIAASTYAWILHLDLLSSADVCARLQRHLTDHLRDQVAVQYHARVFELRFSPLLV